MCIRDSCTDEQLHHIVSHQGRAITMMPDTWKEVPTFMESLRHSRKAKQEIWRRLKPGSDTEMEYFSAFTGCHLTKKRGYCIHWIYSSEKRHRDRHARQKRLLKAEEALMELTGRINMRKLKTQEAIQEAIDAILSQYKVGSFLHCLLYTSDAADDLTRVDLGGRRIIKK